MFIMTQQLSNQLNVKPENDRESLTSVSPVLPHMSIVLLIDVHQRK